MSELMLRLYDGYGHTSPQLRDTVRELQAMLRRYDRAVVIDGLFGRGTEDLVRSFQRTRGLCSDGVVGPDTWHALLDPDTPAERLATTYPLDHPILPEDVEAAARYGASIVAAAGDFGLPPAVIVALGSRESRWGLALSPRDRPARPTWRPGRFSAAPRPAPAAGRARLCARPDAARFRRARVRARRPLVRAGRQRPLCLRGAGRVPARAAPPDGAARQWPAAAMLAAYNCGLDNVLRAARHGFDLDFYTVGRDYSRDVLNRAGFFEAHGWD